MSRGIVQEVPLYAPAAASDGLALTGCADTLAQSLAACYQCGKCTAGCPMADAMDLMPNQIFRLLQLGALERVLRSTAIWQCVSCYTCTTRCPQSVDCVGIIDQMRQLALARGMVSNRQGRVVVFQQTFLDNIRRHGRLHELSQIAHFKLRGYLKDFSLRELFRGAALGPQLFQRRKLHFRGSKVKDRAVIQRIYARCSRGFQPRGPSIPGHQPGSQVAESRAQRTGLEAPATLGAKGTAHD
ncbi:MAG: 4Fe-4S dicluster domain-containing protein [Candidatus Hydrogenedentes bacterium]|nr:4Fe-4S dicluster domain-containing protein [Candidatus Hydrogenedentota bacterium]